jgi:hypothetical protein
MQQRVNTSSTIGILNKTSGCIILISDMRIITTSDITKDKPNPYSCPCPIRQVVEVYMSILVVVKLYCCW